MKNGLDLSKTGSTVAAEDEGQWVDIMNEKGEPYTPPVRFRIAGTFSSPFRKIDSVQTERALKMGRKALRREVVEANRLERAAVCILEWEGVQQELTLDNATQAMRAPWLREQVEEAMQDHAGFSRNASPS